MDENIKNCDQENIFTHFDVNEEADTLKNVAFDSEATALASMVFPFPGGPNNNSPIEVVIMQQTKIKTDLTFQANSKSIKQHIHLLLVFEDQ